MGTLIILLGVGILIFAISRIVALSKPDEAIVEAANKITYEQLHSAQSLENLHTVLETPIRSRLKCPATAVLCPKSALLISGPTKQGHFNVNGYVDAQNSFGAMVRTQFHADCLYYPDTIGWNIITLNVFDN